MALCANAAPPAATITNGIQLYIDSPWGASGGFEGDYSVAGVGTRKNGSGVIKLKSIPAGADVFGAYLIYNTYQANTPVAHPTVFLNGQNVTGSLYGICGSTCWYNPGFEATTYLRNRVYIRDISSFGIVEGNGNYTITGLPTSGMRIGTDGDKIPGCSCSQGAILFVLWEWGSGPSPEDPEIRARAVNMYLGARLLSNNGAFGATPSYNLTFSPVQDDTDNNFFKGNTHIEIAAGDTQNSIPGDSFAINQIQFIPPNNAFTPKIGSSLCVKKFSVAQIYDGNNSAFARTTNDCINWFFFAISGDKTQPKSQFQIVNCVATYLREVSLKDEDFIVVHSNFTQTSQTMPGGICRAVRYQPPLVGPPAPGSPLPPSNPPGMFPGAPPPYYIKINDEIMKVTGKALPQGPGAPMDPGLPDPVKWNVERAQAGTKKADHNKFDCVYMLSPPKFISDIHAGLAAKGLANQRTNPRRPAGVQGRR